MLLRRRRHRLPSGEPLPPAGRPLQRPLQTLAQAALLRSMAAQRRPRPPACRPGARSRQRAAPRRQRPRPPMSASPLPQQPPRPPPRTRTFPSPLVARSRRARAQAPPPLQPSLPASLPRHRGPHPHRLRPRCPSAARWLRLMRRASRQPPRCLPASRLQPRAQHRRKALRHSALAGRCPLRRRLPPRRRLQPPSAVRLKPPGLQPSPPRHRLPAPQHLPPLLMRRPLHRPTCPSAPCRPMRAPCRRAGCRATPRNRSRSPCRRDGSSPRRSLLRSKRPRSRASPPPPNLPSASPLQQAIRRLHKARSSLPRAALSLPQARPALWHLPPHRSAGRSRHHRPRAQRRLQSFPSAARCLPSSTSSRLRMSILRLAQRRRPAHRPARRPSRAAAAGDCQAPRCRR